MASSELEKFIRAEDEFGSPSAGKPRHISGIDAISMFELFGEGRNVQLLKEIFNRGYLQDSVFGHEVVNLVSHVSEHTGGTLFRTSYADDAPASTAAFRLWLGIITSRAHQTAVERDLIFNHEAISKDFIRHIATLSVQPDSARDLPILLSEVGISLIFEPGLTGMKTDGAFTVLPSGVPVIGMTLRYPRLDYFWYTLLHELAHIHLHYKVDGELFADDFEEHGFQLNEKEAQADRLALNSIVPRAYWRRTLAYKRQNAESAVKTAEEFGVHPALIAGRLRREFDLYNSKELSNIVTSIDMREIVYAN